MQLNQQLPYTEETLSLTLDAVASAEEVKEWLVINGISATINTDSTQLSWAVPVLDADGNRQYDSVTGDLITSIITAATWDGYKQNLSIDIPIGTVITAIAWIEPTLQSQQIKWLTDLKTGEKYFPITHIDAVLDRNGNKLSSLLGNTNEVLDDATNRVEILEEKLLRTVTTHIDTSTTLHADGTYKSDDDITLYNGDNITIPANPAFWTKLVDADGNILAGPTNDEIKYDAADDIVVHIETSSPQSSISATTESLAARGAGGGGSLISFFDATDTVTITDGDTGLSYKVLKNIPAGTITEAMLSAELKRRLKELDLIADAVGVYHPDANVDPQPVEAALLFNTSTAYEGSQVLVINNIVVQKDTTPLLDGSGVLKVNGVAVATGFNINASTVLATPVNQQLVAGQSYSFTLEYQDVDNNAYSFNMPTIKCLKTGDPYYVGQIDGSADEFALLTAAQLNAAAQSYTAQTEVNTTVTKQIYFLILPADVTFSSLQYDDEGWESTIKNLSLMNVSHSDLVISSKTYKVYGYRIATPKNLTYTLKVTR